MRALRSTTALLATLGFSVLGLATSPLAAHADEPLQPQEPIHTPAAEILAGLDRPVEQEAWFDVHLKRMNVHEKYGLTYTQGIDGRDKPMTFTIRGPVLGKALSKRRRFGLSFELHF